MDPAFVTKREPHITADLLRQIPGVKRFFDSPDHSYGAAVEGGLRALTPAEGWEVPLMLLGAGGKAFKPALVGAMAAAGTGDAEGAPAAGVVEAARKIGDLLRAGSRDAKLKREVDLLRAGASRGMKGNYSAVLRDMTPDFIQRELATSPVDEILRIASPGVDTVPVDQLDLTKMLRVGDAVVPLSGDTSRAWEDVLRAGVDLPEAIRMYGGHEFGRADPRIPWSSNYAAAASKQENFREAADKSKTGRVFGLHTAMTDEGSNFADHVLKLYLAQLRGQGGVSRELLNRFNPAVEARMEAKAKAKERIGQSGAPLRESANTFRKMGGLGPMDQSEELLALFQQAPELRKSVLEVGDMPGFFKAGMPDITRTRAASLDETVLPGQVGAAVMRADPAADVLANFGKHPTYDTGIPGQYLGRSSVLLPQEMVFRDAGRRFVGKPAQLAGSLRQSHHTQLVDQKLLDTIGNYLRQGGR